MKLLLASVFVAGAAAGAGDACTTDAECTSSAGVSLKCGNLILKDKCVPDLAVTVMDKTKESYDFASGAVGKILKGDALQTFVTINLGVDLADLTAGINLEAGANIDIKELIASAKESFVQFNADVDAKLESLKVLGEELLLELQTGAKAVLDSIDIAATAVLVASGAGEMDWAGAITGAAGASITLDCVANFLATATMDATVNVDILGSGNLDISANVDASIGKVNIQSAGTLTVSGLPTVAELTACAGIIKAEVDTFTASGDILTVTGSIPTDFTNCAIEIVNNVGATITISIITSSSSRRLLATPTATFKDGKLSYTGVDPAAGNKDSSASVALPSAAAVLVAAALAF